MKQMKQKGKGYGASITMKFIIAYLLTAVLLIMSFTLLVFENQVDLIGENALLRTLSIGREINAIMEEKTGYGGLIKELESKKHLNIEYIKIYNEQSLLLATSDNIAPTPAAPDLIRSIQKSLTKRDFENSGFHHELIFEKRLIDLYIPGPEGTFIVIAGISIEEMDRRMSYLFRQSGLMTVIVTLIHLLFAFFTYNALISPLRKVLTLLTEISNGNYDITFPKHRSDEFGLITKKIEQMAGSISTVHSEARNANPLSGLPGNIALEREIQKRLQTGNAFCVLYCDLDQFKAYNDAYGFSRGDEIILYTRDVIEKSINRSHARNCFFGHEGGDDFVIICDYYDWEKIAALSIDEFDSRIKEFYSEEDRTRGYIESVDRKGKKQKFPFVSLSIAVVSNHYKKIDSYGQLAHYAAEMKKVVKGIEGSAYRIDRRVN
ncbi:MAG: adenylate/guanylate cyclase domain-containing protein [Spirochaetales bacterium]|nr:adenylate/guanylate cyclase domain-containing protein [Spirochaetales bacterium]